MLDTPPFGTPIAEWHRLTDLLANGQTVHEIRNVLCGLVATRFEADISGWTSELVQRDQTCEARLRSLTCHPSRRRMEAEAATLDFLALKRDQRAEWRFAAA